MDGPAMIPFASWLRWGGSRLVLQGRRRSKVRSVTVTLALFSLCQLQTPNQASAFWIGFDPFAFFQGPFLHFHTHGSITDRAFNNQIFAPSCIPKVIEAVKQVDKEETKFFPHTPIPVHAPILGIIQEAYVPAHHFDRTNVMAGGDPYVGS